MTSETKRIEDLTKIIEEEIIYTFSTICEHFSQNRPPEIIKAAKKLDIEPFWLSRFTDTSVAITYTLGEYFEGSSTVDIVFSHLPWENRFVHEVKVSWPTFSNDPSYAIVASSKYVEIAKLCTLVDIRLKDLAKRITDITRQAHRENASSYNPVPKEAFKHFMERAKQVSICLGY